VVAEQQWPSQMAPSLPAECCGRLQRMLFVSLLLSALLGATSASEGAQAMTAGMNLDRHTLVLLLLHPYGWVCAHCTDVPFYSV
jgi:hypothetical protein